LASPPGALGIAAFGGRQPHLVRYVAGHYESQPLTRLRRNVNRVGEFDFLLLEFGDLSPQLRLGGLPASSSVRCAKYVRTARRSSVSVHTHHRGQDRAAPPTRSAARTAARREQPWTA
jgi:hypothetical protein